MTPDQEWRKLLLSEIRELKSDVKYLKEEMTTLKIKVALFSSCIGAVASYFFNKIL